MILLWCADIFNVAVEVWLAYWLFDVPKHRRFHQPWVRVLEYLGFLGIVGWNILQNRFLNMRFSNVLILFVIFYFFISAVIFTKRNIFCCLAWAGIYFTTVGLLELPGIVLSGWITGNPFIYCVWQPIIYDYLYLIALSVILLIISRRWGILLRNYIENTITNRTALLWIMFAFIEWWVVTYFLMIGYQTTGRDVFLYNTVSILCILLLLFVFSGFIIYRQSENKRQQKQIQDFRLEAEYLKIKNEYQRKSKEIHDLKHQLQVVGAYLSGENTDKAKSYLEVMMGELLVSQERIHAWTGNPLVDSLLNGKLRKAEQLHIHMDIQTSYISSLLQDKDMSVLLGNLLDNAIEAANKSTDKKIVFVQILNKVDMLFINVKNSIGQSPVVKDGTFVTTKGDSINHGWGMKSIETIIEKYNGQMDIKYDDEYFEVMITFWENSEVDNDGKGN